MVDAGLIIQLGYRCCISETTFVHAWHVAGRKQGLETVGNDYLAEVDTEQFVKKTRHSFTGFDTFGAADVIRRD